MNRWFLAFVGCAILLFLQSDNRAWNRTPRRELMFWWLIVLAIVGHILYEPVSSLFPGNRWLPIVATIVCSIPMMWKIKQLLRKRLTRFDEVSPSALIGVGGLLRKSYNRLFSEEEGDAEENQPDDVQMIGEMVQSMSVLTSSLREFGGYAEHSRAKVIATERRIIDQFSTMSKRNLNRVIVGINLAVLIKDMRDHIIGKNPPKHKTELLQVLTYQRIKEVTLVGKAAIIDALQKIGFSAIPNSEQFAFQVVSNTFGVDLTNLKKLVDLGGGTHNFSRLVYQDVQSKDIRAQLLTHLQQEAERGCKEYSHGAETGEFFLKVISDIDDTLYCQLLDKRWPSRTFYPGVRKFYEELDKGIDEKGTVGDLVFLTARPHGYKGGIEQLTHDMLGHSNLHTKPVILAGTFSHFFVTKDMAAKKYQNFEMYASVYPEYMFVFIGDSGQGDVAFGKQIKKEFKSRIKLILINGKCVPEVC
eukprot:TRINITY_DN7980_c0_g1_i5.p2 TRINITY_DN7980_c0_g1~~TRINITY_DN7980_c0_g1_i5.p2  ORF type:complete len:473 (-),score=135.04 TRINITY_DN7980_c0_g1_i5:2108-3526(-)